MVPTVTRLYIPSPNPIQADRMNAPDAAIVKAPQRNAADPARSLLEMLESGGDIPAQAVALVVAHPDDECLMAGGQLPRLKSLTIVHVTDGAPLGADGAKHGFASRAHYAAARRRELETAVACAGISADALLAFDVPDQQASLRLPQIARALAKLLQERGIEVVLTHAYEGGHPDHDAVAFAVHAARRLAASERSRIGILEMPSYHADSAGWVRQRFPPAPRRPELAIRLTEGERALKRRMFVAHVTQRDTIFSFALDCERFRIAPDYDFRALPNGGRLLYEQYPWGMTGPRWQELAREALANLGLETRRCA